MNDIESLEKMVQKPKKVKKPANFALWVAYVFFNIVVLTFDIVAAVTVYNITDNWGYAILTFLAGVIPLLLHEFLYLRAYASQWQRYIAVFGAVVAVLTVGAVALLAAGVNFAIATGYNIDGGASEIAILILIVGAALLHALLAAIYFYIDEGIRAKHVEAETVAFYDQRMKNIKRAEQLLDAADTARKSKAQIVQRHGGADGKAALEYLLNMLNDDDGDGIPNFLDKVDNRKSFAQTAPQVKDYSNNGQYPNWKLDELLAKLNLTRAEAEKIVSGTRDHDEGYKALVKHGLGDVEISKSNFNNLYYQLKPKVRNP